MFWDFRAFFWAGFSLVIYVIFAFFCFYFVWLFFVWRRPVRCAILIRQQKQQTNSNTTTSSGFSVTWTLVSKAGLCLIAYTLITPIVTQLTVYYSWQFRFNYSWHVASIQHPSHDNNTTTIQLTVSVAAREASHHVEPFTKILYVFQIPFDLKTWDLITPAKSFQSKSHPSWYMYKSWWRKWTRKSPVRQDKKSRLPIVAGDHPGSVSRARTTGAPGFNDPWLKDEELTL